MTTDELRATIPAWSHYTWESQVRQFPKVGPPGITYHLYCCCPDPACVDGSEACGTWPVDTWIYRNKKGHVVGILYRYQTDSVGERAGNVNAWVRPDRQRRGIIEKLVERMVERCGPVNVAQQRYTEAGLAAIRALAARHPEWYVDE